MITVGSLFAGIGGLELGLERAGMQVEWQVEIDDYCRKVLAKHWPEVKRYEDIRDVGAHNLEPVDLICGGFPCQPHSLAGKRKASDDERDLWGEFARLIREVKPRWVLAENVPGLLSSESGRFFGRVLRDLASCGYYAEWDCIPAASVGAPHLRYRVFIVAHTDSPGRRIQQVSGTEQQTETNFEDDGSEWSLADAKSRGKVSEEQQGSRDGIIERCANVAYAEGYIRRSSGYEGRIAFNGSGPKRRDWWAVEPDLGRVAHGVPARVDRLKGLGNAVVPQVAEWVGRRIVEVDAHSPTIA